MTKQHLVAEPAFALQRECLQHPDNTGALGRKMEQVVDLFFLTDHFHSDQSTLSSGEE